MLLILVRANDALYQGITDLVVDCRPFHSAGCYEELILHVDKVVAILNEMNICIHDAVLYLIGRADTPRTNRSQDLNLTGACHAEVVQFKLLILWWRKQDRSWSARNS